MSDEKWLEEIDACCEIVRQHSLSDLQRNLNDLERRRWDHLAKMSQQQAANVDLLTAEAYVARDKPHGTLVYDDLNPDEKAAITSAKNVLELTNARMRVLMVQMRNDCGMPAHARLRGFGWYDESSGKPVKIVRSKD